MSRGRFLLDTNIVSEVIKPHTKPRAQYVLARFAAALTVKAALAISGITEYEIRRGLFYKDAQIQLKAFDTFLAHVHVIPVSSDVLLRASQLWAFGRKAGRNSSDSDTLIAATALIEDQELITRNVKHFDWIPQLRLSDWFLPTD